MKMLRKFARTQVARAWPDEFEVHRCFCADAPNTDGMNRAAEANALRDLLKVLNHELMNALTPVASMSKSALDLLGDDTPGVT